MTATYNKYYDTYIKQKTTGAITGGYAFRVDGNSNLNGNVNIHGTLTVNNNNIGSQISTINNQLTKCVYDPINNFYSSSFWTTPLSIPFTSTTQTFTTEPTTVKNGTYTITQSSETQTAYNIFNGLTTGTLSFTNSIYTLGVYSGAVSTTYNTSLSVLGEWVQIQFPYFLNLSQITVLNKSGHAGKQAKTYYILGSNDGVTWTLIYNFSLSGQPAYNVLQTINITPTTYYTYFRYVANSTFATGPFQLAQLNLYGIVKDPITYYNNNLSVESTLASKNLNVSTLATCPTVISTDNSTNIATTAFVKTALTPYALISSLSSYNGGSIDLSPYALISSLSSYVTSSALSNALSPYALISSLSSYNGGSIDLSPYALISSLSSYVTSTALTTALSSYVTSTTLTTYFLTIQAFETTLSSYYNSVQITNILNDFLRNSDADALYQTKVDAADYFLISQFSTALSPYLTISNASATYQLKAEMVDFLSEYDASTIYQTKAAMSSYATNTSVFGTYQQKSSMSNYLTTANASSTYQTITNMSNYVTNSSLATTLSSYVTSSSLSSYITSSSLISTLSSYAKLTTSNVFQSTTTFNDTCQLTDMVLYNGLFNSTIQWVNGVFTSIGTITCQASTSSMNFYVYTLVNGFKFSGGPISSDNNFSAVQPYTQLIGAGSSGGYTTSAVNEVFGKNNNNGATGYFIVNTYSGYTPSNTSGWNSSNGFYYAPMNGIYSINMNIFVNNDTLGNKYVLSHHNSAGTLIYSVLVHSALATQASDKLVPYSTMLKMNTGDYFKVSLSVRNGTSSWWFGSNPLHSSMTITKVS